MLASRFEPSHFLAEVVEKKARAPGSKRIEETRTDLVPLAARPIRESTEPRSPRESPDKAHHCTIHIKATDCTSHITNQTLTIWAINLEAHYRDGALLGIVSACGW